MVLRADWAVATVIVVLTLSRECEFQLMIPWMPDFDSLSDLIAQVL